MKANTLYDIFETTKKNDAPDLTIGLAMLRAERPDITDDEDKQLREFMGRHYDDLVIGYRTGDREAFALIVDGCKAKDEKKEVNACDGDACEV